jgi:hypothetical protein
MNMLDQLTPVEGMGAVGEIRLKPDPETFTRIANTSPLRRRSPPVGPPSP